MKEFARAFYQSQAWKKCRTAYAKSRRGLCERCLERGIVRPGVIVHHLVHVTPENVGDPDVVLDWENLQLVCRNCHAELHAGDIYRGRNGRRYRIDEYGRVNAIAPPFKQDA